MQGAFKKMLKVGVYGTLTFLAYVFPSFFLKSGPHTTTQRSGISMTGVPYAYADAPGDGGDVYGDGDDDDGGGVGDGSADSGK